jgi:mediator of RNA polymerase II transcription subunit 12
MPSRVTLNDSKRQAWFADLANPDVPLYKLGKSVPHGAKGHDLLDLLHSNNVAIPRAVWFLRVFGANETVWNPALFVTYLHLFASFTGRSEKQTVI